MESAISKYRYLDIMFWAGVVGYFIPPIFTFGFFIALFSGLVYFVFSITQLFKSLSSKSEKKNISEIELPGTIKQSGNKSEKIKYAFYLITWLLFLCLFFTEGYAKQFGRVIFFLTIIRGTIAIWDFITRKKAVKVRD
ncbi:MAG: hypothetical protein J0M18_09020 [Ignavibacteria bacterium]|nr:hypothetical protein [Ignavibacteria bacterium]